MGKLLEILVPFILQLSFGLIVMCLLFGNDDIEKEKNHYRKK